MFQDYYNYYHFILSKINPLQSTEIKQLLDTVLDDYNDRKHSSYISGLRKIAVYLENVGKPAEARMTRNWIILLQHKAKQETQASKLTAACNKVFVS